MRHLLTLLLTFVVDAAALKIFVVFVGQVLVRSVVVAAVAALVKSAALFEILIWQTQP